MRLAWFSPLPPVRTGLSVDSRELLCRLGSPGAPSEHGTHDGLHEIDVFVDEPVAAEARRRNRLPGQVHVLPAHEFAWRHQRSPYDLTVYQLGNSAHHAYQWPYLFRHPGLLVLHDGHLHHSRAAALMGQRRHDDYRAEFAACQNAAGAGTTPGTLNDAAELAIAGFDSHLYYYWPLTRLVVEASKITAVHTRALRDDLAAESPQALVEYIHLAHGTPLSTAEAARQRTEVRTRLGIDPETIVFGCFGGLTPEKRLPQILDAFAAIRHRLPPALLLFGGEAPQHADLASELARRKIEALVTGYVEDEDELTSLIAASDVTVNLRWPTARELSGPWLRSLAAGTCTIVSALAHLAGIPTIDAGSWVATAPAPVAVAVDLTAEIDQLPNAMRRLAGDRTLREQIGSDGRAYWHREHSYDVMIEDYRRLLPLAASRPAPRPPQPRHLVNDASELTARLLAPFGVPVPWSTM